MKEKFLIALIVLLICAGIYGCFALKIWACKQKHVGASTIGCLLSN